MGGIITRRRVRLAVAVGAATIAALGFVRPPSAAAERRGPDCTFTPGTHVVTVPASAGPTINITRNGASIVVNSTTCGTVTTVDTVNLDLQGDSIDLDIDETNGYFAPGFSSEASGASEIEFDVTNTDRGTLFVHGTSASDVLTAGERTVGGQPATGIELNGVNEAFAPDDDVILHSTDVFLFLIGQSGDDYLSGQGTGAGGSAPYGGLMYIADGPGEDQVIGGDGDDQFSAYDSQDEGDSYAGMAGRDLLSYSGRTESVRVTLDDVDDDGSSCVPGPQCEGDNVHKDVEIVYGGSGNDGLFGESGNQQLDGGPGDNNIRGGGGNDTMMGGQGTNVFGGGPGRDTVIYFNVNDGVAVTLDNVKNDGVFGGDDVQGDVEIVVGGAGNDQLTGNTKANRLFGGEGNDTLDGSGGNDLLDGGNPVLPIFSYGNTFDGNDVLLGGSGVDTVIERHMGQMVLSIDDVANDRVPASPSEGVDNIHADVENVTAIGDDDDHITGSSAKNRLNGGKGGDELLGLGGDDVLIGGPGSDTLTGGPGLDTAAFSESTAAVKASLALQSAFGQGADDLFGLERLTGSKFGDTLTGNDGPNVLTGGGGPDTLKGLAGDDRLVGGAGNDKLDGGPDTDTCLQGPGSGPVTACEH